ncbi:hypothetical protein PACTADRAFT_47549 [Pachysolen tannophilus NRRL Y-2460]|uniref:Magnesium-dependent phosphatase-1 n=1 Tax=Pachysolen tannophilus NRRL Y-2460 TaxID=669874 RepID=A0A1E4U119_PACTA|nr:hypothetical protein PACTADRAFT_47549 [Pachysolen tannophilus NRRL Y-2460]
MTIDIKYPKIVVFDLDYTLWPCWCDTHISKPIKSLNPSTIIDSNHFKISFYKDVPKILHELNSAGVIIATASRTCDPQIAKKMLKLLKLKNGDGDGDDLISAYDIIDHMEWGTFSKINHLKKIASRFKVDYREMVLFDDELRNKDVESKLGVKFIHIADESIGLTYDVFLRGLKNRD